MKKIFSILSAALALLWSCTDLSRVNPYEGSVNELTVTAVYPEGFENSAHSGVKVRIENTLSGVIFQAETDASGKAVATIPNGVYRIGINDLVPGSEGNDIFNGAADKIRISGRNHTMELKLTHSKGGEIVIRELYCGGCSKEPEEGTYQSDKYAILHNNTPNVQYLDSLCFGFLSPYNSNANNPWLRTDPETGETSFRDSVYITQAVIQFPGGGTSFPLGPGEDAIIALSGAIDHARQYPLSVNLNREDVFAVYNTNYFPNPMYHPVYGDKIREDHILDVVVNVGQANAYTVSLNSPAMVLFRTKGISMKDYALKTGSIVQTPGSRDRCIAVPVKWILDALEVFNGGSSSNTKRLPPSLDAGYVTLSEVYKGRTLFRRTDESVSAGVGYEYLQDTNNSTSDFYERETQSLHE